MKILAATNNPGKLKELKEILEPMGFIVISAKEAGLHFEPEENGSTFEENAVIKAVAFMKAAGFPALSDDSGLEVDHLGGAPGVHSARYAPGSDEDRVNKLLSELGSALCRSARFVSVVAIALTEEDIVIARGECEGSIGYTCLGSGGFGYDPIFFPNEWDRSFAELLAEEKNSISHRGRALRLLSEKLKNRQI